MGIHWNSYGWDCTDCGEFDMYCVAKKPYVLDEEYARLTKGAADHSRNCPALNEVGQPPRDYSDEALDRLHRALCNVGDLREYGEYNGRVPDQLPPPDNYDWLAPFGTQPTPASDDSETTPSNLHRMP